MYIPCKDTTNTFSKFHNRLYRLQKFTIFTFHITSWSFLLKLIRRRKDNVHTKPIKYNINQVHLQEKGIWMRFKKRIHVHMNEIWDIWIISTQIVIIVIFYTLVTIIKKLITRDVMIIMIQVGHFQRLLLLPPATGHVNTTAHDITALMHQYHRYCFIYSSTESWWY